MTKGERWKDRDREKERDIPKDKEKREREREILRFTCAGSRKK